ncbi:BadF/BadG/BcrA/BcrD ATPase family protein [Pseudorhodobacter sp. MZDSW-24AT]|uniref:BadF/BadG/BcrA/BcrD ATPase family protein n=1 Tax=Pseudorhodobacter sp. MZDSW-24AT TaxID=2052957 RepID=UPI000C1E8335|nr:BadF/BadG/BcrA/BcrD ATPase family protein [Pseudorhodobacter sp. MZDSW-24AT]PJF09942.1 ATPase [Pseudorhodobacter sp. MZDSW-24AT]
MALYLGIDGGGTGCRAVVADERGHVLGSGQGGPANIASDPVGARDNILEATRQAMVQAVGAQNLSRELPLLVAGLGLAGANAAGAAGRLRLGLPFARARIETDAVAAALGALADADGIVAAIGTGSVFAVQSGGQIRCYGGWGLVLGDEGSGAWLGRAAYSSALRAVDGFEPMTPFLTQLLDDLGGPAGVVSFAQTARATDFAKIAPSVVQSKDLAATRIWSQAVSDMAKALSHLRKADALPVTFIGGLGASYAEALAQFPQRKANGTALDGALRLAREGA